MLVYNNGDELKILVCRFWFCGWPNDIKPTSGYVFKVDGEAISWKSVKQTITASSNMQPEFIACYKVTIQAVRLEILFLG